MTLYSLRIGDCSQIQGTLGVNQKKTHTVTLLAIQLKSPHTVLQTRSSRSPVSQLECKARYHHYYQIKYLNQRFIQALSK